MLRVVLVFVVRRCGCSSSLFVEFVCFFSGALCAASCFVLIVVVCWLRFVGRCFLRGLV